MTGEDASPGRGPEPAGHVVASAAETRAQRVLLARAGGILFVAGASLALASLALPGGPGRETGIILAIAAVAYAFGALELLAGERLPIWAFHALGAGATLLVAGAVVFGGETRTVYAFFYFWIALYYAYLFPWRETLAQFALVAVAYAAALVVTGPAKLAPALWLVAVGTLAGAASLVALLRRQLEVTRLEERERLERTVRDRTAELRESEERYRELIENANDVIFTVDLGGRFTSMNRAGERSLGYAGSELLGRRVADLVVPEHVDGVKAQLLRKLAGENDGATYEVEFVSGDGARVPLELSTRLVYVGARPVAVQAIGRDVSERRALEGQLTHRALHDPLTGLPNRALFRDRLTNALVKRRRESNLVAVLFLDLDDFKRINDRLGHAAGDALLAEVGARLRACLRSGDTPARLGGDEFAVLLDDLTDEASAKYVAERILGALRAPAVIAQRPLALSASIGIAHAIGEWDADQAARGVDRVIGEADAAMYRAKSRGKGRCEVFTVAEPRRLRSTGERA